LETVLESPLFLPGRPRERSRELAPYSLSDARIAIEGRDAHESRGGPISVIETFWAFMAILSMRRSVR